jgi:hypothetical protein
MAALQLLGDSQFRLDRRRLIVRTYGLDLETVVTKILFVSATTPSGGGRVDGHVPDTTGREGAAGIRATGRRAAGHGRKRDEGQRPCEGGGEERLVDRCL